MPLALEFASEPSVSAGLSTSLEKRAGNNSDLAHGLVPCPCYRCRCASLRGPPLYPSVFIRLLLRFPTYLRYRFSEAV